MCGYSHLVSMVHLVLLQTHCQQFSKAHVILTAMFYFNCSHIHMYGAYISHIISLEMPVPSQGHYGFHSFPVVD